ncbi:hypothetical protein VUN82_19735 [Micrococcaceae bacterium Sec5.1]
MSESADAARTSLLELAAQLVAVSTSTEGTLGARMSDRFPWMLALSPADREVCADDVLAAARASFATNQPHLAIAELTSWRETATAIAAGLGKEPLEWLDDSEAASVLSTWRGGKRPKKFNYPLRGELGLVQRGGATHERWQHKPKS